MFQNFTGLSRTGKPAIVLDFNQSLFKTTEGAFSEIDLFLFNIGYLFHIFFSLTCFAAVYLQTGKETLSAFFASRECLDATPSLRVEHK